VNLDCLLDEAIVEKDKKKLHVNRLSHTCEGEKKKITPPPQPRHPQHPGVLSSPASFSLPRVINHKLIHHHESLHSRAFAPMFFTVKLTTRRPPHHFLHHLKHHWHQQRQLVFSLSSNNSVPFTTTQFHAAAKHNQPPTAAPSPWTTHT
jgi:hypothetical protein